MKIKTFTFEDNSIFKYNKNFDNEDRKSNGEYYYIKEIDKIDYTINEFINSNNIEVVDIKVNNIVKGNNPPTSILVYTIIYKERSENNG